jgi:hypothetical protein
LVSNKGPVLFQAYNFRVLTDSGKTATGVAKSRTRDDGTPGRLALVAYPAAYGLSGVMSFIVGPDGSVYQKDLGPDTAARAATTTQYLPDPTWAPVPAEP